MTKEIRWVRGEIFGAQYIEYAEVGNNSGLANTVASITVYENKVLGNFDFRTNPASYVRNLEYPSLEVAKDDLTPILEEYYCV